MTISTDQHVIPVCPGSNGTLGFHSPEHETTGYDRRTDIWALGVSFFRVLFGRMPWLSYTRNNPWRSDHIFELEGQEVFHIQYRHTIHYIISQRNTLKSQYPRNLSTPPALTRTLDCLFAFLLISIRFKGTKIES